MVDINKILEFLDADFKVQKVLYENHRSAVINAVKWWGENAYAHKENFADSLVMVNGIECVCVSNDFRPAPFYICELHFYPLRSDEDAGSGVGKRHTFSFSKSE